MKLYFESDIVWKLDQAIIEARENNQVIKLIELDIVESQEFLDVSPELHSRGIIRIDRYINAHFYRNIQLKLNTK